MWGLEPRMMFRLLAAWDAQLRATKLFVNVNREVVISMTEYIFFLKTRKTLQEQRIVSNFPDSVWAGSKLYV